MSTASKNPQCPPSRARRLVRTLRNLTALGLLTLSVGVLALWVRSYLREDALIIHGRTSILSQTGSIHFNVNHYQLPQLRGKNWFRSRKGEWNLDFATVRAGALDFHYQLVSRTLYLHLPHWLIALVFAALAFALKPKPRLRFSLSDLMVLMTFAAMLAAGVMALSRLAA